MTEHTFYVSPKGNDNWTGRRPEPAAGDGPFRTLYHARDVVRYVLHDHPGARVTVLLRGGTYFLIGPLLLDPLDSGTAGAPVIWAAFEDEEPVLDCGRSVTGWRRVPEGHPGQHPAAAGKLWETFVSDTWRIKQLYMNDEPLPRSASVESDDWQTWPRAPLSDSESELAADPADLAGLGDARSADLNFLPTPYTAWSNALTPVREIDPATGRIAFEPVQLHRPEVLKDIPFRIENILSGIRRPGQWFLDHSQGRLYLWPPDDENPNLRAFTAPFLARALVLQGRPEQKAWLRHIVFSGLTVAHANLAEPTGEGPRRAFDAASAAVSISDVEDCTFQHCRITRVSGGCLSGSGHLRRLDIRHCEMSRCGGFGIRVSGSLAVPEPSCAHNTFTDNHIHDCGRLFWHSAGISIGMSDRSLVAHNLIHDMPYAGIMSSGLRHRWFDNWPRSRPELAEIWREHGRGEPTIDKVKPLLPGRNRIEKNIIHHVMKKLDDGGAIYCHAGHDNLVRANIVHHTVRDSSHGLYFDDEETDSRMEGNLVYASPADPAAERGSALHLHNNARNTVVNNIFVTPGGRLFTFGNAYGGHRILRNVFVFGPACKTRATPAPVRGPGDGRRQPDWDAGPSQADYNLYWSTAGPGPAEALVEEWRTHGLAQRSRVADPRFADPASEDFALRPDSPAFELGFQPLEVADAGPRTPC